MSRESGIELADPNFRLTSAASLFAKCFFPSFPIPCHPRHRRVPGHASSASLPKICGITHDTYATLVADLRVTLRELLEVNVAEDTSRNCAAIRREDHDRRERALTCNTLGASHTSRNDNLRHCYLLKRLFTFVNAKSFHVHAHGTGVAGGAAGGWRRAGMHSRRRRCRHE